MINYKKVIPVVLVVAIVGVGAYFVGKMEGVKTGTKSQQALVAATDADPAEWWPAGNGYCYHKIRNQWTSYWVLGQIKGLRCIGIGPLKTMDNLDSLIKSGGMQLPKGSTTTSGTVKTN